MTYALPLANVFRTCSVINEYFHFSHMYNLAQKEHMACN